MTQEEKQLLLKDLCARLPHGVICHTEKGEGHLCSINQTIFGTEYGLNISPLKRDYFNDSETDEQAIKPYFRTLSRMTEEERREYDKLIAKCIYDPEAYFFDNYDRLYGWLNEHHFDYRGLIPMGLALEVPADMYKQ